MTATQVTALDTAALAVMETADMAVLSTAAIRALSTDQMASLSTDQIQNLTTVQVSNMNTYQIQNLTTDQVAVLTTAQLHNLTAAEAHALTPDHIAAMSTAQISELMTTFAVSPLVLDLNGDGIKTVGIDAGVHFDLTARGQTDAVGWVSAQDGFLAMDLNHDGQINDGSELFGVATVLANGEQAHDGFEALAAQDSNHDGVIDAADANFSELSVWTDSNQDGVTDAGELHALKDLGITQLDLAAQKTSVLDQGNWIGLESTYSTTDGVTHALSDVWMQINQAQNKETDLSKVDPATIAEHALARIDISGNGGSGDTVVVSAHDVEQFGQVDMVTNAQTGMGHLQMMIQGDANDLVKMTDAAHWVNAGTTVVDNQTFEILNQNNLQLLVGVKVNHDPTA